MADGGERLPASAAGGESGGRMEERPRSEGADGERTVKGRAWISANQLQATVHGLAAHFEATVHDLTARMSGGTTGIDRGMANAFQSVGELHNEVCVYLLIRGGPCRWMDSLRRGSSYAQQTGGLRYGGMPILGTKL